MEKSLDWLCEVPETEEKPCWMEVLDGAVSGLYPAEHCLERMLDYLERTE